MIKAGVLFLLRVLRSRLKLSAEQSALWDEFVALVGGL